MQRIMQTCISFLPDHEDSDSKEKESHKSTNSSWSIKQDKTSPVTTPYTREGETATVENFSDVSTGAKKVFMALNRVRTK